MIPLEEQFTIDAPPEAVWPLLADPVKVAACLPGAAIAADKGDGVYEGTMRVKFGPTVVTFRGEMTLTYDHALRCCAISGRGIDQRGASRALASGTVSVSGSTSSLVTVAGEYHVTGPLEMFARTGGVHLARTLMGDFARNIAQLVASTASTPLPEADANGMQSAALPPSARELGAGALVWRSLLGFLRGFFRRHRRGFDP